MTDNFVKQLQLVTDALEASLTEPMSKNWVEFCEALIEHSRSILEETK